MISIDTRIRSNYIQRSDSLNQFYSEINSYPILSAEEEVELFISYRNGDEKSRDRIIECNQRFVVAVAKKFAKTNAELMELISEGNLGLMKAVEKFDFTYGFKFISYAVHWIYSHISHFNSRHKPLIHKGIDYQLKKQVREIEKHFAKEGISPNVHTIISLLDEKYNINVDEKTLYNVSTVSIDIPVDDEDYTSGKSDFDAIYYSYNGVKDVIENDYNKYIVERYLDCLTDIEREVVKLYYGIDYDDGYCLASFVNIGERLNIPDHRASGHYRKALAKMKKKYLREKSQRNQMIRKITSDYIETKTRCY